MPSPVVEAYLALGSNLGDRLHNVQLAVRRLAEHPRLCVTHGSPVFETLAHTLTPDEAQPDYLNAVVRVCTAIAPEELLAFTQAIERDAGRERGGAGWQPRTLDIDLLAFGDRTLAAGDLIIPHPRLDRRRFVLAPWAAIAPDFTVPAPFNATVSDLLARCEDTGKVALFAGSLLDS